jgi:hypothetical protein
MPIVGTLVRIESLDRLENRNVIREVLVADRNGRAEVLCLSPPAVEYSAAETVAIDDAVLFLSRQPAAQRGDVTIPGVGRLFLAEW